MVISSDYIFQQVREALITAGRSVPRDVENALIQGRDNSEGRAQAVFNAVLENIEIARNSNVPLCQDTGMVLFFVELGESSIVEGKSVRETLYNAVESAYGDAYFRKSVVADPLKDRVNTGNNLPPVIYYDMVPGDSIKISLLLKGFGSENCCRSEMLSPTASREQVIDAVCRTMEIAGGKPCPPVVLGIGLGGTFDYAAKLSKKALLRDLDDRHPDPYYADMEQEIFNRINALGIGPGGMGGPVTTLGVMMETFPTHIAGLPLAVSTNCWADRKAVLKFGGSSET